MRLGFVTFVLLIATAIFACGDELPSVSDPPIQLQQATEPSAQQEDEERPSSRQQTRPPEAGRSAESSTDSETDEVEKEPPPEDPSVDETAVQEPEREAGETRDAPLDAEVEDAELESEAEPKDLTNVPAVVMEDADVRVRPGLSWRVIGQLGAGEAVVVLNAASGWFRISFGDDREGWIRKPALDLGEIETRWILYAPAPAIVAEWQGEQHGVMGQSADGAEIRLLPMEDELAEMVSAPIDEVTLLADDITVHDLPILIGDETVVFPGDDFRAGQGKILPKANEWIWLPSGWLLAHNDSHIWEWRAETDELEFTPRPSGPARFSPDGQYLAILRCVTAESRCLEISDFIILPLDGSAILSFLEAPKPLDPDEAVELLPFFVHDMHWVRNGKAVLVSIGPFGLRRSPVTGVLMSVRGQAALLTWIPETVWPERDCEVVTVGGRPERVWWMRLDNRVAVRASCHGDDDGHQWIEEVFSLSGESVRLEASKPRTADHQAADGTDQPQEASALEEEIRIDRSRSRELAIVPEFETKSLWLYDSTEERLLPISDALGGIRAVAWQDDHVVWDTYWHGQERVAIVPRWDYYGGRGALLVDLSSRIGVPFDYGDISLWPCLATGVWNPEGDLFQIGFYETVFSEVSTASYWIDGLAARRNIVNQRVITDADGNLAGSFRTIGDVPDTAAAHRAAWSPKSSWFAIGGHVERGGCHLGE